MHDIDRTLAELDTDDDADFGNAAGSAYEPDEGEFDDDGFDDSEFDDNELDDGEFDDGEFDGDDAGISEEEELELASDLLAASDDEELEQFLGKVFRKVRKRWKRRRGRAGRRIRRVFKRHVARHLKRTLKRAVKVGLGAAGSAAGGAVGGPAGAAVGGQLLAPELEGLGPEDQEFEMARGTVRMTAEAMKQAMHGSQTDASPERIVRSALESAARRHAPGLLRPAAEVAPAAREPGRRRSPGREATKGHWVRRGDKIVLYGV